MTGRVHSIQSLGTVDGPGVRFTVFLQGCNLRCHCCHNPDTWAYDGGNEYLPEDILKKVLRCREYFGPNGGITFSGGEPLLQAEFVKEVFVLCKENGINTCVDTAGSILNNGVKGMLEYTDRVLLDIKYTNDADYIKYAGCALSEVLEFLRYLQKIKMPVTLRQVIIPTVNDTGENILRLKDIISTHPCVDKVELLPFKKICRVKYDNMGIKFKFDHIPQPTSEQMTVLENILK